MSEDTRRRPFYGFYTSIFQVSNRKPRDGEGDFTDFTDFTPLEKGVYVAPASRGRPRPHTANTSTPFNNRKIRKIRKIARRQGRIFGRFHPPGVKSVKCPPVTGTEVTA